MLAKVAVRLAECSKSFADQEELHNSVNQILPADLKESKLLQYQLYLFKSGKIGCCLNKEHPFLKVIIFKISFIQTNILL